MTKSRAKNLDDGVIGLIVSVLDGWSGKLTWDLLAEAIERRTQLRYTRQALDKHARIKMAFQVTKERLSGVPRTVRKHKLSEAETEALLQRYERLLAENERLERENNRLLEQFQTWLYNAHLKGLTKDYLDSPLPRVDREQTKLSSTPAKSGARRC
ncbi:hypothetical protein [Azospira sp.]|uniref:hypothetical protein n=1 Tax=Azospira sp. TaxID=1872671 RepID=UPI00256A0084|nr:hypothetical protein [Azospira sp.]MDK9689708.1 hypothetical protein [Azospira sp.]